MSIDPRPVKYLRWEGNCVKKPSFAGVRTGKRYLIIFNMEIKPALGIEGTIITTIDGRVMFRVYNEGYEFIDYDIHHSDLWVKITDPDSVLYSDGKGINILDHHPRTLGKE